MLKNVVFRNRPTVELRFGVLKTTANCEVAWSNQECMVWGIGEVLPFEGETMLDIE
jgi:hypothetical protein